MPLSTGALRPGDIIAVDIGKHHHWMVFIGNGQVIHSQLANRYYPYKSLVQTPLAYELNAEKARKAFVVRRAEDDELFSSQIAQQAST